MPAHWRHSVIEGSSMGYVTGHTLWEMSQGTHYRLLSGGNSSRNQECRDQSEDALGELVYGSRTQLSDR